MRYSNSAYKLSLDGNPAIELKRTKQKKPSFVSQRRKTQSDLQWHQGEHMGFIGVGGVVKHLKAMGYSTSG